MIRPPPFWDPEEFERGVREEIERHAETKPGAASQQE